MNRIFFRHDSCSVGILHLTPLAFHTAHMRVRLLGLP